MENNKKNNYVKKKTKITDLLKHFYCTITAATIIRNNCITTLAYRKYCAMILICQRLLIQLSQITYESINNMIYNTHILQMYT